MLTEFWWGISSYGKWGASTDRSCAGGGFAACVPSRTRQLGWSVVGSLCGINSVNLYTTVSAGRWECLGVLLRRRLLGGNGIVWVKEAFFCGIVFKRRVLV